MTSRSVFYILSFLAFFAVACDSSIEVKRQLNEEVSILPDYKEVTIPFNITPLNFQAEVEGETALIISGNEGAPLQVRGKENHFIIPPKQWKSLLASNKGGDLILTVCKKGKDGWESFIPFQIHVAEEEMDPYIAYRLIQPGYTFWNLMGIYQRDLTSYSQTAIYENRLTDYNCVNCHSFPSRNPESMLFHMRAKSAGTVLMQGDKVEKLNTKTDETVSALVYPYWHPSGKYMAFSVNSTLQAFFAHYENLIEVFDNASDVVIYDVDRHEVFSTPLLKSEDSFETFPTFSPDGKSLYFCSAQKVDSLPFTYKDVHYSLCRIDVDVENRTFGTKVDTLYNAVTNGGSISFPRISPDGKYMVVTKHDAGNFSIWHPEADLYIIDLESGEMRPLEAANSPDTTDSYHSWSSNSRWLVFSSRRLDGLYTRPYFTYIDKDGHAHKPFLLPQENPMKHYDALFYSFNIPEFIKDKVEVNPQIIARMMKDTEGIDVTYSE